MTDTFDKKSALAFIVAFGIVSLFADMAYEGMRGITGPYLALLGASGTAVGIIAGTGELFGYLLRLASGKLASTTRAYWPITLLGYVVQMATVPLMALAGAWWMAALFIILERTGKAIRNPAANFMMSRAGDQIGQGWAFGLHEALDQTGALIGPLITALVLARHGAYTDAFLWLGAPATITVLIVIGVSLRYPGAGRAAPKAAAETRDGALPTAFWLYAASAGLVAFGFADWPLIAYHFAQAKIVPPAYRARALCGRHGRDRRRCAGLRPPVRQDRVQRSYPCDPHRRHHTTARLLRRRDRGDHRHAMLGRGTGCRDLSPERGHRAACRRTARAPTRSASSPRSSGSAWFAGSAVLGALYDISFTAAGRGIGGGGTGRVNPAFCHPESPEIGGWTRAGPPLYGAPP